MRVLILISLCFFACVKSNSKDKNTFYKVVSIDSLEKAYLIVIEKNKINYKILSLKKEETSNIETSCKKIKVNKFYEFKIKKYIEEESNINELNLSGIMLNGITIELSDDLIYEIYIVDNLEGLCWFN